MARTIGKSTTSEGAAWDFGSTPAQTTLTEVAWVDAAPGKRRLAILDTNWEGGDSGGAGPKPVGDDPDTTRTFKKWVSAEGTEAAVSQWTTARKVPPQVYAATEISGLN